ncbi:MAG TPA: complex I subunit 5 family protein [Thermoanaerobaculaceae bacterium]|nr:complex I subunit 5 family protein [Thermoanaerobaculaceae bacterium]
MATILLPVLVPLVLAALAPALRRSPKALAALPVVAAALDAACFLALSTGASLSESWVGSFRLEFGADPWQRLLLGFVVLFQAASGVYALRALPRTKRPALLAASLLVAFASAWGVVAANNVLMLLIFWEMFLVALYGAIHAAGDGAERVAQKALIIGGASDFLMILGLIAYLALGGGATFGTPLAVGSSKTALVAFVLIFLGAGAKAGMFPFHTWIPEAAEVMPAAGFATLPASLEKVLGISFLFTLTSRMFVLNGAARGVMLAFAVATAFVVIAPALVERNLKRVLALTAISPVGFMIAGMATSEALGVAGALFYMLTHATYKSGMFFAAGAFEDEAGGATLAQVHGSGRRMPALGLGFALAFVAAISLPPTGGFMAKELIFEGLSGSGHPAVLALLAVAAILNIAVFCKVLAVVLGATPKPAAGSSPASWLPVVALGSLAFLTGLVFTACAPSFGTHIRFEDPGWIAGVWHVTPLTMASLAIYLLGFMLYLGARERAESAAATFEGLRSSPVLGAGLAMAAEKRFDAYEIGLNVVEFVSRVVFRYFERLIDVVTDAIIGWGRSFSRHALSAIHNGVYANYLGWAVIGLIAVLTLVFL